MPTSVFELFGSPLRKDIIPSMWRDIRGGHSLEGEDDESIESFIARRFSQNFADNLVDPMISGIYAGDIRRLSVRAVFPLLKRLEDEHGSVFRGAITEAFQGAAASSSGAPTSDFVRASKKAASVSFAQGMESFPRALAAAIQVTTCLSCVK